MHTYSFHAPQLFAADARALLNGIVRLASHPVRAPIERIAAACDVSGLLVARRMQRHAGASLYRAAGREGRRLRRGGLLGCFRYLSELT
jgi:hypothetical protein